MLGEHKGVKATLSKTGSSEQGFTSFLSFFLFFLLVTTIPVYPGVLLLWNFNTRKSGDQQREEGDHCW